MKWRWSEEELCASWFLSSEEVAFLSTRRSGSQFGLAVQFKFFQNEGRFPQFRKDVPVDVLRYLARQLSVNENELCEYDWKGRTARRHRFEVLSKLGLRRLQPADRIELHDWLQRDMFPHNPSEAQLEEQVNKWFQGRHLAPLDASVLEPLLRSQWRAFELGVQERIEGLLNESAKASLDKLLEINPNDTDSSEVFHSAGMDFQRLKSDPGRTSLKSVLEELSKLQRIREIGLPATFCSEIPEKWLARFSQRAGAITTWELRRQASNRRYALAAAFCQQRRQGIVDGLVDLLIQVIHKIGTRAESKIEKELLDDFKRVKGKAKVLFRLAEAAIDKPDGTVKEVLYPVVSLDTLKDLVKEFKASGPAYKKVLHTAIRGSYGNHYRRMLQPILDALEFKSNNTLHRPVIEALTFLKKQRDSQQKYFSVDDIPVNGLIQSSWRSILIEKDKKGKERSNRISYELCVLQALRERLRSKEICVVGARRYQNPDNDLPQDFNAKRADYYAALNLPEVPDTFIDKLKNEMLVTLSAFNESFPKNKKVKLRPSGKNRIILTPLDPQPEPINLDRLKAELFKRWHATSLLDVLKETDLRVGFTESFHSAGSREVLDKDTLQRRLLLCLYGLGTNTGLKRLFPVENGISYRELLYVRQRFMQKNALREAIAKVVNATFAIRQSNIWGEGSTACASDAKKFGAWDQNLMTEWHIVVS